MTPQEQAQKAYDDYYNVLRNGKVTADTIKQTYAADPNHVERVLKIKTELDAQQAAGSKDYYSTGSVSVENATWDMAFRLAETGISSVQNMERKIVNNDTYDSEFGQTSIQEIRYFNKETGADITDTWNRVSQDNPMKTNYNLHFTDDGMVMPYTSRKSSSWVEFRDSTLKPIAGIALAAYGVPYVAGAMAGATVGGVTLAQGSAALAAASSATVAGGVSLLAGNSFEDALKNALVGGLTAGAAAGYADTIGQTFGFDAGSVASKAAGNAVVAAVKAGVTDENVLESMVKAAVSTAISSRNDGVVKAADEDLAAGLNPEYGSNQTYDAFMSESMRNTNTYNAENQNFDTDEMGRIGQFGDAYNADNAFDATANEGSLAKPPTDEGFKFDTKDLKTGAKIAGVLMAGDAVIDQTIGSNTSLGAKREDPWRNAPIDGFRMAKFEDPATGKFKYVPFVKDSALLPPPSGYKEIDYYAKGGFVTKRN